MYDIIAILIPIVLAVCIVYIVRIVCDYRRARYLAEADVEPAVVEAILHDDRENRRGADMRWGVSSVVLGMGMVLIQVCSLDAADPLAYGILFISMGLGLLVTRLLSR